MLEEEENSEEFDEEIDDQDFQDVDEVVDSLQELEMGSDSDESLQMDDYSAEDIDGEKESVQMSRQWYKRIEVDLWKTQMHMDTIGIRQQDQYRAQSRQFTASMKVIGDINFYSYSAEDLGLPLKERKKPQKVTDYKEILGINETFWKARDPESIVYKQAQKMAQDYDPAEYADLLKRLVIKTFTQFRKSAEAMEILSLNANNRINTIDSAIETAKVLSTGISSGWVKMITGIVGLFAAKKATEKHSKKHDEVEEEEED